MTLAPKAAQAQVMTAASKGRLRLRLVTNCESIRAVIGSQGMCFEVIGAKVVYTTKNLA